MLSGRGGSTRSSERYPGEVICNEWLSEGVDMLMVYYFANLCLGGRDELVVYQPLNGSMRSRMMREYHVRFCERLGGEIPPCLLDILIK